MCKLCVIAVKQYGQQNKLTQQEVMDVLWNQTSFPLDDAKEALSKLGFNQPITREKCYFAATTVKK